MNSKSTLSILGASYQSFIGDSGDSVDDLAKRAIHVIECTSKRQTGDEAETDWFVANMYASAALTALSDNIKHYPFVRPTDDVLDPLQSLLGAGDSNVVADAQDYIERAEALLARAHESDANRFRTRSERRELAASTATSAGIFSMSSQAASESSMVSA